MASDVAEVFPEVVIAGWAFSWKITFNNHWHTNFVKSSSLYHPMKQRCPMQMLSIAFHIGIYWQTLVIVKPTNECARDLKVGFDVNQLGIAAAKTFCLSLQKVSSGRHHHHCW